MTRKKINIGICGAGAFARFAAGAFAGVEGVSIVAVFDVDKSAAAALASQHNAAAYTILESLLEDKRVSLVYIATPPHLHYDQSCDALFAGKHVICEKPAALHSAEAQRLKTIAGEKNLLYVVNLMQRYNPLFDRVKTIIDQRLMGNFLHGFFENYASDERLDRTHWFWNVDKSGGIFIEHGVHFFDLFNGWLGNGEVLNALQLQRPQHDPEIFDRVMATVLYPDGPVHFYHGFDQTDLMDRQEIRLQFELGEICLYGWIPVMIRIYGLFTNDTLKRIIRLFPDSEISVDPKTQRGAVRGRGNNISYDVLATIRVGRSGKNQIATANYLLRC